MKDQLALGIAVVRITMTDYVVDGVPASQLWAAAVARSEAVAAVMRELPPHWTDELTDLKLTQDHARHLSMKPETVSELSSAG